MSGIKKSFGKAVTTLTGSDKLLSWEKLVSIEKRRRAILRRSEEPFWRILSYWDGTCIALLTRDFLFWFTILLYLGILLLAKFGLPNFVSEIDSSDIGVIGGFLSFFLVFFVVQSNGRLSTLYGFSMACKGRIFDVATILSVTMPQANALRLVRYMNAAHTVGYVGLSDTYHSTTFFAEINSTTKMLTVKEMARINEINMDTGGSACRELIVWCMMEVETALNAQLIDRKVAALLREHLLALRGSIGALYNFSDQPISFFYVHFVTLLSAMYLPLFAISAAVKVLGTEDDHWTADVIAFLIVLLQTIFVIGLRVLGQKMIDPYGDDVEDLSVMHYVNFTWINSNRIIAAKYPEQLSTEEEEKIVKDRATLGGAWTNISTDNTTQTIPLDSGEDKEKSSLWRLALSYPSGASVH